MIVSIVIPAFNASDTIGATLSSIFDDTLPGGWELDVVVANDGSPDGPRLAEVVGAFPNINLLSFDDNRGKQGALNAAVPSTRGDVVMVLDADDTLLPGWSATLKSILETWPEDAPLCFSACQTPDGNTTVADPDYTGVLTFDDILNERHMGEYLPVFRGDAIRAAGGYRDPGKGVGCELWTYLSYAQKADLWISRARMRVYFPGRPGSLTSALFAPQTAKLMVRCYELVLGEFEHDYRTRAPRSYGRRQMRQAVFCAAAGDRAKALSIWRRGARITAPVDSLGTLVLVLLGGHAINTLVALAKKVRLVRRYG